MRRCWSIGNVYERQALASVGVFADSYTNNVDALEGMALARYDIVISDIGRDAGGETGWELLAEVRRRWPNVPFFFYTSAVDGNLRSDASRCGATGITAEPDELAALVISAVVRGAVSNVQG